MNRRSKPVSNIRSRSDSRSSGIYEYMKREIPAVLQFQNERQRNGIWVALSQDFFSKDNVSVGWGHAGATPGDPGGQHNYNPSSRDNSANMYTIAWKHRFDKHIYWYLDAADTVNKGNAHYDNRRGWTRAHDGLSRWHEYSRHRLQQRRQYDVGRLS